MNGECHWNKMNREEKEEEGQEEEGWKKELSKPLLDKLSHFRKYDPYLVTDLLRFIRNTSQHFLEQEDEVLLSLRNPPCFPVPSHSFSVFPTSPIADECSDDVYLAEVKVDPSLQKAVLSHYFTYVAFPTLLVNLYVHL